MFAKFNEEREYGFDADSLEVSKLREALVELGMATTDVNRVDPLLRTYEEDRRRDDRYDDRGRDGGY